MIFERVNGHSPVQQDFIWLGEYLDSSYVSEFDFKTQRKKDFYQINKNMLSKFGLIGQGMKLYFDTKTGTFMLNGMMLNISYRTSDAEYHFTGFNGKGGYNDIITFKDAYTDADIVNPNQRYVSHIHQFNFGYKKKIVFEDGMSFQFQALVCIPYNKPAYVELKIVPSKDLDGEVLMKRTGRVLERVEAPLKSGYAGICQWAIK